jgi:RNA polymerase sigma-70 factor, ECF subfamily
MLAVFGSCSSWLGLRSATPTPEPYFGPPKFNRFILPHLDAAYNYAYWLMNDPVAAEDAVQNACLEVYALLNSGRCSPSKTMVLSAVRSVAHARIRTKHPDGAIFQTALALNSPDRGARSRGPEFEFNRATEEVVELRAAIVALPIDFRECVVLGDMEMLSYKEIGQIVGASTRMVAARLHRARTLLVECFPEMKTADSEFLAPSCSVGPRIVIPSSFEANTCANEVSN